MKRCCFLSIRKGSYLSLIYTLIVYTIQFMSAVVQVYSALEDGVSYLLEIVFTIFALLSIVSSLLLLIGIASDNRNLFIPWLFNITVLTLMELLIISHLFLRSRLDPLKFQFLPFDFLICIGNAYSLFCVYSLYQSLEGYTGPSVYQKEAPEQSSDQGTDVLTCEFGHEIMENAISSIGQTTNTDLLQTSKLSP